MRTFFKGLIFGLALLFALAMFTAPVQAGVAVDHYEINVYADTGFTTASGGTSRILSGITYKVLTDDTNTAATIYSDPALTAMTNPVTTTVFNTKDRIDFYVAASVSAVDIIIVDTAGGYTTFLDDATEYTRTAIIDERPNIMHHGMIWWEATTGLTGVDTDTGIDFDIGSLVHRVIVDLVTATATSQLLCVGIQTGDTSGDHDGFINDMILSTAAGWYDPMRVGVSSAGADDFIINATAGTPLGVLLGWIQEGTSSSANVEQGLCLTWDYLVNSNGQSLSYSLSSGTASITDGYIHYFFTRMLWLDRSMKVYP